MKTLFPSSRSLDLLLSHHTDSTRSPTLPEGRPQPLRWVEIDCFVVDTVLGLHRTHALVLDDASKRHLDIPVERLVVLPGEERRARMEQVKDYCGRCLHDGLPVNGFEVAYLLEFFDTPRAGLAACLGMDRARFDAIVDEDDAFGADISQGIALYFLHAWKERNGTVRFDG